MTNRLELNWKLDGFVDEQRYYCSETQIDPANLPAPKAVLANDVRSYVDTAVEVGKTYYVAVGSVKNGVEKISGEVRIITDQLYIDTDFMLVADSTQIKDLSKFNRAITIRGNVQYVDASVNTPLFASGSYYFDGSGDALDVDLSVFGVSDFTIEMWAKFLTPNSGKSWHRYFDLGDASGAHAFSITNNATDSPQRPQMYAYNTSNTWQQFIVANKSIAFNEYKHICLMRKSGVFYLFAHGQLSGSNSANTTLNIVKNHLRVGADLGSTTATASESKMYLDSFRVVKDAIYSTVGFTPPSSKFIY